jgi:primosomal protein N' (replication factor Y)
LNNEFIDINPEMPPQIARIAIERTVYSYDALFDYLIPWTLSSKVQRGMRVLVPFGKGAKKFVGMVFDIGVSPGESDNLKFLNGVADERPILNKEQLQLAVWLRDNTFCTYFDAVKSILPTGLGIVAVTGFYYNKPSDRSTFSQDENKVMDMINSLGSERERSKFISKLENSGSKVFYGLLEKKVIIKGERYKNKINASTVRMIKLSEKAKLSAEISTIVNTPKQRSVIRFLEECQSASVKEICYNTSVTAAVIKNLTAKGLLIEYEYETFRRVIENPEVLKDPLDIKLSSVQQGVYEGLLSLLGSKKAECALLRGITGSGKTLIFIKLIEYVLNQGKTALLLVPEIALTPQMTGNFTELFGDKVAIMHSGLSLGQRNDEYKRISGGQAKIVIGTRSAVFSPLENIGIIVIDEEGEHSYKSDKSPRYHARDVAKLRAVFHNALLLLASATPSLESYHYAKTGRYRLFELEERYQNAILPDVYIVDMKLERELFNPGNFSEPLLNALGENLKRGEQSMILLNRRGYHTFINCIACGEVLKCPNCDISLTYHKINDIVLCHCCGFRYQLPDKCRKCGSKFIRQSGVGTQRIEEELGHYFPKARVLRMDADTTMTKYAYENNFKSFGNGDFDIMVGTQMIAKGLDFENVTLVGVLMIDKSLYAGDYLGYERTFSLVTQVVGRSGRGGKKGRAYLQTFTPEHYVLELAASQNYKEFFVQEAAIRKELIFPPFCDIFLIGFSATSEENAILSAKRFIDIFGVYFNEICEKMPIRLLGPTKIGTGIISGKYRQKLVIKAKNTKTFRGVIEKSLKKAYKDPVFKNIGIYVDMNGEIN